MARNASAVHAYSDLAQAVYTAPLGTTMPTSPSGAYPAGWIEAGWITDNGITETTNVNETKKYGWQGATLLRVLRSQLEHTFQFECAEENAFTFGLLRPSTAVATVAGTAEVQTLTVTATGGTFTLTGGYGSTSTTSALTAPGTAAAIQTAVQALPGFGAVTVTGSAGGPYTITFPAALGNVAQLTVGTASLTGGTATIATTTQGTSGTNTQAVQPYTGRNLRQFGIDLSDGVVQRRLLIANGEAVQNGNIQYQAQDDTIYQFTLNCYPDANGNFFTEINNDPNRAAGLFA